MKQLTPFIRILIKKLIAYQFVTIFTTFNGAQRFIYMFTRGRNWSLF